MTPTLKYTPSYRPSPTTVVAVSAVATLLMCVLSDTAFAANARSNAGLATNNETYIGFGNNMETDTSLSSASRSTVHNRPLAVDSGSYANSHEPQRYEYITSAPATSYDAPRTVTTTTRRGNTTTVVKESDSPCCEHSTYRTDDVNARADAGTSITHPIVPAPPIYSNATGGVKIIRTNN